MHQNNVAQSGRGKKIPASGKRSRSILEKENEEPGTKKRKDCNALFTCAIVKCMQLFSACNIVQPKSSRPIADFKTVIKPSKTKTETIGKTIFVGVISLIHV